MSEVQKLGFQPKRFGEIKDRNASLLIQIDPEHPYQRDTLDGYYDFLNCANHFLDTASLDNKEFSKAVFSKTTGATFEEVRGTPSEARLLVNVRESLKTDQTGIVAINILAEERIRKETQNIQSGNPEIRNAYIHGIELFISDYKHLFTSLVDYQHQTQSPPQRV